MNYAGPEPTSRQQRLGTGIFAYPTVRTRKHEVASCSVADPFSHAFEEKIAAERAKLEAQLASVKPGPQMDALSANGSPPPSFNPPSVGAPAANAQK